MTTDVTKITTDQAIFDLVAEHLLTMPHRSMTRKWSGQTCSYRGDNKLSCAVGCLLTDDECRLPDGRSIDDLVDNSVGCLEDKKILPRRLAPHVELLSSLQSVHDNRRNWHSIHGPDYADGQPHKMRMTVSLRRVAEIHDLNETVLDRFTETGESS